MPDTGWKSPTKEENNTGWSAPKEMKASDNVYAIGDDNEETTQYQFGFSIPSDHDVNGIEVSVEGHRPTGTTSAVARLRLMWNGRASQTDPKDTPNLQQTTDATYLLGSPTDKWGRVWVPGDFSNANFAAKVMAVTSADSDCYVDHLQVKVYYAMNLVGVISGQSIVSGTATFTKTLAGVVSAQSGTVGFLSADKPILGVLPGQSTLTGKACVEYQVTGNLAGQSALTGDVAVIVPLVGQIGGSSQLEGYLLAVLDCGGLVQCQSGLVGALSCDVPFEGNINCSSSLDATFSRKREFVGTIPGASLISGKLAMCYCARGILEASSSLTGVLPMGFKLAGLFEGESQLDARIDILGETESFGWGGVVIVPVDGGASGYLVSTQ